MSSGNDHNNDLLLEQIDRQNRAIEAQRRLDDKKLKDFQEQQGEMLHYSQGTNFDPIQTTTPFNWDRFFGY